MRISHGLAPVASGSGPTTAVVPRRANQRGRLGGWVVVAAFAMIGCGPERNLRLRSGADFRAYVRDRSGGPATSDIASLRFRPNLCDGEELRPDYARLDETSLIRFFERQRIDVRIERPRADLVYLNLGGVGTERPARLRVAVLATPDEAGRELHEAVLEHGIGSWGVHRANLAVLGPAGDPTDDVAFAAMTKLACWGVFTIAGMDDSFVVPGAYTEL
jgi:hypothetical protein